MRLNTWRLGGWGVVLAWDGFTIGVPGAYFGAGIGWPWDAPSRHELPPGCTMTRRTIGWLWLMWGRRRSR